MEQEVATEEEKSDA